MIVLNGPEECGKIRVFRVSSRLVGILQGISKEQEFIFGSTSVSTKRSSFKRQTKRMAQKLANPRLSDHVSHVPTLESNQVFPLNERSALH
jgi:hypothetical protein